MAQIEINDLLYAKLRKRTVETEKTVDFERTRYLNEAYREFAGEPEILIRAKFYDKLLSNKTIYIDENLFVGSLGSGYGKYYLYPEWGVRWTEKEDNFRVPEEEQADWDETVRYWRERTLSHRAKDRFVRRYGRYGEEQGFDILAAFSDGLSQTATDHPVGGGNLNYERAIREGLEALIAEAEERYGSLEPLAENNDRFEFYEAVIIELKAVLKLAGRYEALARSLADQEQDPARREQLLQLAEVIARVPAKPARNLREAIQAQLFVHLAAQLEQVGCAYSLGFLGQVLDPYYKEELAAGTITEAGAIYLLKHFYLKLNDIAYYYGRPYDERNSGDLAQTISVGGYDIHGNDATAPFDHLILEAQRQVRLPQPATALIYHHRLDPAFVRKAFEVVATGIGMPQFMNADAAVQRSLEAYSRYGATIGDARRSCVFGCVSTAISNKSVFYSEAQFNLAKAVELALNDGRDPRTGDQVGPHTGRAEDFAGFDELLRAFEKQVETGILVARKYGQIGNALTAENLKLPIRSAFVDGCLERGKDLWNGGSDYLDTQFTIIAGVDAGNSLEAVKKLVYEDKALTIREIKEALKADFEGYEELREALLAAPKYGNGKNDAVALVRHAYRFAYEAFERAGVNYLGLYSRPDAYSKSVHNYFGLLTGALPSGRKAGIALTDGSVSASPGTDVNGPTALVSDAASAIDTLAYDSAHLNVKLSPAQFKSENGYAAVNALVRGFMDLGGSHIQFNCIDSAVLREAKAHPEAHRDLVVRVAGFSAYFVKLHEGVQDEIIMRTEHAV